MAFLSAKGLRAEVTEGIDLEQGLPLTGDRITIGTGPNDTLRLGAADIAPAHLTLQRRKDGKGWEYFAADRGQTLVDRGNPRTGSLRAGMWFRLGAETKIEIQKTVLPATDSPDDAAKTTVPLPVAFGLMSLMVIGFALAAGAVGRDTSNDDTLLTSAWFTGAVDLDPYLETCLSHGRRPTQPVAPDDPAAAFWTFGLTADPSSETAVTARDTLTASIRTIITQAHLLEREGQPIRAAAALHRLEYVLPVGDADCPILQAARVDQAQLERSANR